MKLCIVTHSVVKGDGQGRVNYEIVQDAIQRGHRVTLLASKLALELQHNQQIQWICIEVKQFPTAFLRNLIFSWRSGNWLRKHRAEFDLVKVNGAITNVPGDVNVAHFVHSSWLNSPAHTWRQRQNLYGFYQLCYTALNAYWERQAFRQAKVIVAVSHNTKKDLIHIRVPAERIQVIENGVDLQEFYPDQGDRQQWGLPDNVPLALFVGDLQTPRKNLDTVLQALVHSPQLHLAIVGATEGSPYPRLVDDLSLTTQVHFLGYQHRVAEIMRTVDFLVFPSRYETFGLVILEAMASGLPVITASTTGASGLVTPDAGFVLANADDLPALIQMLHTLASDSQLRKRMGKSARAIAQQHSWISKAKRYVDLFEELIIQ